MLSITDLKVGVKIDLNDTPYTILRYSQSKQARGGSVVKVTMRNLLTGSSLNQTFQGNDKIQPADITRTKAQYTYNDGDNYYFMDNESFEQFSFSKEQLGDQTHFLIETNDVDIVNYKDVPINIELKPKVEIIVTETPPGVRGDTASGGSKPATLATGLVLQVPFFVNQGDTIRVNTDTSEYVERVS